MLVHTAHSYYFQQGVTWCSKIPPVVSCLEGICWRFQLSLKPWPWGQQGKTCHKTHRHILTRHYAMFSCKSSGYNWNKRLFLRIWACTVTLTLRIGTQTFCMTLQVMMIHQYIKIHWNWKVLWFRRCEDNSSLRISILTVALTLSTAIWFMMMSHYTKFGCKRLKNP